MEISMISADLSGKELGSSGASVLAAFLPKCTVLSSLNLYLNKLGEVVPPAGWTKRRVESQEEYDVYGKEVFVHADGTKQRQDPPGSKPEGLIAVTNAIKDMGALTKLAFGDKHVVTIMTMTTAMTEANFSGRLKSYEAHIVAAFLPKCTALITVIMHTFPLPIKDIKTNAELDLSRKGLNDLDAIVLAALLPLNGAMTSLNISGNWLGAEGAKHIAAGITDNGALTKFIFSGASPMNSVTMETTMAVADFSEQGLGASGGIMLSAFLPKCTALTKLDISGNYIGAEQEGGLQRICVAGGIELAK
jgi:hypothetical protein